MPRKNTDLTVEQINDFLTLTEHEYHPTIRAVRLFLEKERTRRKNAGKSGGRPKSTVDARTRNTEAVRRYRAKKK